MASAATASDTFAPPSITLERRDDGALLLRSSVALQPHEPSVAHAFRRHAAEHPQRVLVTQARPDGSRRAVSYGEALARSDALAQRLLERGLGAERPVMVLSGNSIEHLIVMLACFTAGIPIVPVSVAYSLQSKDHERVRWIAALCSPGLVFADDAAAFGAALSGLAGRVPAVMAVRGLDPRAGQLDFAELTAGWAGAELERALARVGPETVAKILFTSGSTGVPKGVINTHRMLCSNQQALRQVWPFLCAEPPVLVDWLPWSHTFGGNHNVNQVLVNGGTLHIDDGKPAPPLFAATVAALREHAPTVYYNVPAGYALLAGELERDRALAATFFSRLRFIFYAGAALPQSLWDRLRAIAPDHIPLTASWGTTETAPCATTAHFASARCGCIGVPVPGVELKLVPLEDKLEMRVRGPNITPGYFGDDAATRAAFDEEGFYCAGDAGRLLDERDPGQGVMFDGRLAENFKLMSGTFVTVGALRERLVSAAGGVIADAVICGHDREYASALAWVNQADARALCGSDADVAIDHPRLRAHLADALAQLNEGAGSAARIERLLLAAQPPSIDGGEITDKGYINQRAVLERRQALVARLYEEPPPADVITPAREYVTGS